MLLVLPLALLLLLLLLLNLLLLLLLTKEGGCLGGRRKVRGSAYGGRTLYGRYQQSIPITFAHATDATITITDVNASIMKQRWRERWDDLRRALKWLVPGE